jgi:nitroreductase
MELHKALQKRVSIRSFSNKKVSIKDILKLIESASLAPSPGNLSLLKYIIIENPNTISKIADACTQEFIKSASTLIIICSDSKIAKSLYEDRANKYVKHAVGASVENMLLKAVDLGIASSWVGAFVDKIIKRVLNIPEEIEIEVIIPLGYKSKTYNQKSRQKPDLGNIIFYEEYKNKNYIKPEVIREGYL